MFFDGAGNLVDNDGNAADDSETGEGDTGLYIDSSGDLMTLLDASCASAKGAPEGPRVLLVYR